MRKRILCMLPLLCALANNMKAQTRNDASTEDKGIHWTTGLSWKQIKQKAKAENKYIFIDAYATWCVPCKEMEKKVFVNDSVGDVVNRNFIAVRVQMDTSKNDDNSVKDWYKDAAFLMHQYRISAFPTYLFFSPKGEIVHKETGFKLANAFISICADALKPERQYFTLLKKFEHAENDFSSMPYLSNMANQFRETELAKKIALEYIDNYLLKLSDDSLFTKSNLSFITQFTRSSKVNSFPFLFNNADKIDGIMKDSDYVQSVIYTIIYREEITPEFEITIEFKKTYPNWDSLYYGINEKYNAYYADRVVLDAKARWYQWKKDWSEYCKYTVGYVEQYGVHASDFDLALKSWAIFQHSTDQVQLKKALTWTRKVIDRTKDTLNILPNILDTYANLLYKANYLLNNGQSCSECIAIEEKALNIAVRHNIDFNVKTFSQTIEKMKQGSPTW